jgi:hypothetical protein
MFTVAETAERPAEARRIAANTTQPDARGMRFPLTRIAMDTIVSL